MCSETNPRLRRWPKQSRRPSPDSGTVWHLGTALLKPYDPGDPRSHRPVRQSLAQSGRARRPHRDARVQADRALLVTARHRLLRRGVWRPTERTPHRPSRSARPHGSNRRRERLSPKGVSAAQGEASAGLSWRCSLRGSAKRRSWKPLARPGSFPPRTTKSFALPVGLPLMPEGRAHSLAHVPEDRAVRGAGLGLRRCRARVSGRVRYCATHTRWRASEFRQPEGATNVDPHSCAWFRIPGGRSFVPFDLSSDPINHICRNPRGLWHHGPCVFLRDFTANDALTGRVQSP
jgi:hypothetical protein